jgi:hypothetical protein
MRMARRTKKCEKKTINEILKQEVASVNLPRMWQAFRSLTTTKHARGRAWKKKEGRLEKCSSFWFG